MAPPMTNGRAGVGAGGDAYGVPPPSTLAAQIVEQQKRPNGQAVFLQLLEEIRASPSALEDDVDSNHKLISVILEAGMQAIASDEGVFSRSHDAISQAIACLDVIEIAFKRSPGVLFHVDVSTQDQNLPLCLLLIAKLFSLWRFDDSSSLWRRMEELLLSFVVTLNGIRGGHQDAGRLMKLYEICANDLSAALQQLLNNRDTRNTILIQLPSANARSFLVEDNGEPLATKSSFQTSVSSISHALSILLSLVSVISRSSLPISNKTGLLAKNTKSQSWLLQLTSLCQSTLWTFWDTFQVETSRILAAQHLQALCATITCMRQPGKIVLVLEKTSMLLIGHVSAILDNIDMITVEVLQPQLTHSLRLIKLIMADSYRIADSVRTDLLPQIRTSSHGPQQIGAMLHELGAVQSEQGQPPSLLPADYDSEVPARPFKRRKFGQEQSSPTARRLESGSALRLFCDAYGFDDVPDDGSLVKKVDVELLHHFDEKLVIERLSLLARIPCAGAELERGEEDRCDVCHQCQSSDRWDRKQWSLIYRILSIFLESTETQSHKDARVLSMIAIRCFANHVPHNEHLSLSRSTIGVACLQGLRSSSREVRIAAVNAMPSFLRSRSNVDDSTFRQNRVIALDILQQMMDGEDARLWESSVRALGQVACACDDEELNIILLRLVECLGSTNNLVCELAQLELRGLAQSKTITIEELFKPFWKTIAISMVKDLQTRPQKPQKLADVLGKSVDELLVETQEETLPYLVLCRQTELLQRIANARSNENSIVHMCMQPQNLTKILATLLVQNPTRPEATVAEFLTQASPEFGRVSISTFLGADVVAVACELLRMASDADGAAQKKITRALTQYAKVVDKDVKSGFFSKHVLGMMTTFQEFMDNPSNARSQKIRHLKAIKLMIELATNDTTVALPQVRACLQSALNNAYLRDQALLSWLALLDAFDNDTDLGDILEQTFTILLNYWDVFKEETQQQAYRAVQALLANPSHKHLIPDMILLIPSLQSIPLMSKIEAQLAKLRETADTATRIAAFSRRCRNENASVALQALRELVPYLTKIQQWLNNTILSEQPNAAVSALVRTLLDLCSSAGEHETEMLDLCAQGLGAIGCMDPVRIEAPRGVQEILVLSNFEIAGETVRFVAFMLDTVLVKAFHSAPNPRAQGFLAYVMQELLKFCKFSLDTIKTNRPADYDAEDVHRYWARMTEATRNTLMPLLTSRYILKVSAGDEAQMYPIYNSTISHGLWLRSFVHDLLSKGSGDNAKKIFKVVSRVIRGYDISISSFLLPFVALNVIIGGTVKEVAQVKEELLEVLKAEDAEASAVTNDTRNSCSSNVFQVLDYLSKWLQGKRKSIAIKDASVNSKSYDDLDRQIDHAQVTSVEEVLSAIPADVIASRAVECGAYSRALFHWEQFMRQQRDSKRTDKMSSTDVTHERDQQYHRLHSIYAQIDEPDGIEGISHYIQVFEPEEQILEHEKNGRWAAAQSWYDSYVNEDPGTLGNHLDLMNCLQRAGQHTMVLDHGKICDEEWPHNERLLSMMTEAAWSTSKRLSDIQEFLGDYKLPENMMLDFNIGVGKVFLEEMSSGHDHNTPKILRELRLSIAKTLSPAATTSLQSCHDQMLKLHSLYEIDMLTRRQQLNPSEKTALHISLSRRLDIVGSYLPDKQYLLAIRRAVMDINNSVFDDDDKSQLWLQSARLARKGNRTEVAYNAILNALQLGDESAKIEQSRLLWKSDERRKAIQSLEGAILSDAFAARSVQESASMQAINATAANGAMQPEQNILVAKANLLLAKWLDKAGQTQSNAINEKYQYAVRSFSRWEKGLYYLGKFYNKVLEAHKALPPQKQESIYVNGQCARLVVENYLRSLHFGCKYLFETMPKLLTLWLDFGIEASKPVPMNLPDEVRLKASHARPETLEAMNKQVRKYADKIAVYLFYPALAQMLTRVCHPHHKVYDVLVHIIVKVAITYPQQALWPLLATSKSSTPDRAGRGLTILNKLRERANKTVRNEGQSVELKDMIAKGQKLSEQMLRACETTVASTGVVSLSRDLGFSKSAGSCPLVVPVEKTLTASIPTGAADYYALKAHKAFPSSKDAVTIQSFTDDVLVLNSLQKPRKLTARGTDGLKYGLLCKPKDDMRKDQRLMEFNAMVNRALKKDAECSQRRLYIRTYAVTPLNEECGIIEWVDGLKALRDIILQLYRSKGISVNYNLLRELLNEACARPGAHNIFTNQILPMYPAILHEWFTDTFSDPESWFNARIRYTRSAAVASIVGHSLGLGDRHGENVMLEEGSGGVFHVDFNCLFEKGLTFEKPELVPFRLTHNMVDAFGVYGVEGPFRRSAECTAKVLRASEDALLTILETFVYDPTADFMGGARRRTTRGVPETPKEVLESVGGKLRGLLKGENVSLSVEGHVDALIRQATDPANLCALYIGWLAML